MHHYQTRTLIEEEPTDGHSPLKFLCNDGKLYYCKYRIRPKPEELDFLVYEVVSQFLLRSLDIPTPNIAFVTIQDGSYRIDQLRANKRYLKPGVVCFGSQAVPNADLVRQTEASCTKTTFKQLINPLDLIHIAVFDLWTNNVDRGRAFDSGCNYNLLRVPYDNKTQFVAFDNAFTFGGEHWLRAFNSTWPSSVTSCLFNSPYYRAVIKHIPVAQRYRVACNFLNLCYERGEEAIRMAFNELPPSWATPPTLQARMAEFLLNKQRRSRVEPLINQFIDF